MTNNHLTHHHHHHGRNDSAIDDDSVIVSGIDFADGEVYVPSRMSIDRNLASIIDDETGENRRGGGSSRRNEHGLVEDSGSRENSFDDDGESYANLNPRRTRTLAARYAKFKGALSDILERPRSSWLATIWGCLVVLVILLSVAFLVVESFPSQYNNKAWWIAEAVIVGFFTLEYLLRLYATCDSLTQVWKFVKGPMNVIDLLSFVPFYVEVILDLASFAFHSKINIGIFRVLRLFRVFRLIRITQVQLLLLAISKSMDVLGAILMYLLIALLIASTLIYYLERGKFDAKTRQFVLSNGTVSPFQNIPICAWWAIVSMTTTGYGDMVPTSALGKLVGGASIVVGVLVIALPSMIIGRKFGELSSQYKLKQKMDQRREQQRHRMARMNENEIRLAQETDLIKALGKHDRLLSEQMQQMQDSMTKVNETREMIRVIMTRFSASSEAQQSIYQSLGNS